VAARGRFGGLGTITKKRAAAGGGAVKEFLGRDDVPEYIKEFFRQFETEEDLVQALIEGLERQSAVDDTTAILAGRFDEEVKLVLASTREKLARAFSEDDIEQALKEASRIPRLIAVRLKEIIQEFDDTRGGFTR
jgi:hypothetical protein